jgi:hypothetical protein
MVMFAFHGSLVEIFDFPIIFLSKENQKELTWKCSLHFHPKDLATLIGTPASTGIYNLSNLNAQTHTHDRPAETVRRQNAK